MKQETLVRVLRAYQTHYPSFFKDKTEKDKALLLAEWQVVFKDEEDRLFLVATGRLAQRNKFFPTITEIQGELWAVKVEAQRKQVDDFYHNKIIREYARMSDYEIELLNFIDSQFGDGSERINWYEVRKEAQEEIGGIVCLDTNNQTLL